MQRADRVSYRITYDHMAHSISVADISVGGQLGVDRVVTILVVQGKSSGSKGHRRNFPAASVVVHIARFAVRYPTLTPVTYPRDSIRFVVTNWVFAASFRPRLAAGPETTVSRVRCEFGTAG